MQGVILNASAKAGIKGLVYALAEWYRLYELPRPERNKPWKFKHLTIDQVYRPLAKSNGKILQLTKEQRENSRSRWKKLHQFLSEIGVKTLRTHLGQLLGIARISKTKQQYEQHWKELFGDQLELDLGVERGGYGFLRCLSRANLRGVKYRLRISAASFSRRSRLNLPDQPVCIPGGRPILG